MNPEPRARLTGVVYLLYFVTAVPAQILISHKLVVFGQTLNVLSFVFYIAVTLRFYSLFKPVNRDLSLVAAMCSLTGSAVGLLNLAHRALPIHPLWFFGPYCLLLGVLILRSIFLPRFLGVLLALAGLGWIAFLWPPIEHHLSVPIEATGVLAEASLMLWLLSKGVDVARWQRQSAASAAG
jgi:hypothetical protein